MGSYSASTSVSSSTATDKRQVASDNAVSQSIDGSGNITGGETFSTLVGSSVNILDGKAINSAFDFANKSLSSMIALAIDRDKTTTAAAAAVRDSAAASIAQIGNTAAQTVAAAEDKATAYKKWALYLGLGGVAYWLWSRK